MPYSLNNNGEIVGTSSNSNSPYSAFVWTLNTGIQPLANFGGETVPEVVNDSGQIAGYSTYPDGTERAAVWSPDGSIQDLGTLPKDEEVRVCQLTKPGVLATFAPFLRLFRG